MKKLWLIFFIPFLTAQAQQVKSDAVLAGPMLGPVELRTARVWLQVSADISFVSLNYWKTGHPETVWKKNYLGALGREFNPIQIDIGGLDMNSQYSYQFILNHTHSTATGSFRTRDLWQWRKPRTGF